MNVTFRELGGAVFGSTDVRRSRRKVVAAAITAPALIGGMLFTSLSAADAGVPGVTAESDCSGIVSFDAKSWTAGDEGNNDKIGIEYSADDGETFTPITDNTGPEIKSGSGVDYEFSEDNGKGFSDAFIPPEEDQGKDLKVRATAMGEWGTEGTDDAPKSGKTKTADVKTPDPKDCEEAEGVENHDGEDHSTETDETTVEDDATATDDTATDDTAAVEDDTATDATVEDDAATEDDAVTTDMPTKDTTTPVVPKTATKTVTPTAPSQPEVTKPAVVMTDKPATVVERPAVTQKKTTTTETKTTKATETKPEVKTVEVPKTAPAPAPQVEKPKIPDLTVNVGSVVTTKSGKDNKGGMPLGDKGPKAGEGKKHEPKVETSTTEEGTEVTTETVCKPGHKGIKAKWKNKGHKNEKLMINVGSIVDVTEMNAGEEGEKDVPLGSMINVGSIVKVQAKSGDKVTHERDIVDDCTETTKSTSSVELKGECKTSAGAGAVIRFKNNGKDSESFTVERDGTAVEGSPVVVEAGKEVEKFLAMDEDATAKIKVTSDKGFETEKELTLECVTDDKPEVKEVTETKDEPKQEETKKEGPKLADTGLQAAPMLAGASLLIGLGLASLAFRPRRSQIVRS